MERIARFTKATEPVDRRIEAAAVTSSTSMTIVDLSGFDLC